MSVGSVLLFASPDAHAALIGAAGSDGFYAHCNVAMDSGGGSGSIGGPSVKCQYGPTTETVTAIQMQGNIFCSGGTCTSGYAFNTGNMLIASGYFTVSRNSGGQFAGLQAAFTANSATVTSFTLSLCQITLSTSGAHACTMDTATPNSIALPARYPNDWYTGGSSGNPSDDVSAPTYTCARTIGVTSGGLPKAKFTATRTDTSTSASFTDTYSWAFGDSNTSTQQNPGHTYSAAIPDDGWTATLTTTRTLTDASNHEFTDGTTAAKTTTCSLRVDPNNPSVSTPGTTGTTDTDSSSCPSGWGWLNPAAIVTIATCLFEPTTSFTDQFTNTATNVAGHYPTGPIAWGVAQATGVAGALKEGVSYGGSHLPSDCNAGATVDFNGSAAGGNVTVPVVPFVGSCSSAEGNSAFDAIKVYTYWGFSAIWVLGSAVAVYRMLIGAIGGSSAGVGEATSDN